MTHDKYIPPKFDKNDFHCALCNVYAHQGWYVCAIQHTKDYDLYVSCCSHCKKYSYWFKQKLIQPKIRSVESANADMPDNCKEIYNEAADIVNDSPRAAIALLRLCVQQLMPHIGGTGKNINNDIGQLVENGLDIKVQQALDVCRVVGNNAVHPGEIQVNDNPELANTLFTLINFVVTQKITLPKQIEESFNDLPEGTLNAIARRDGTETE